ncbi:MAG: isochorismate synthase [Zoogloeaceae bacterium]|jgi:isochorismate synthase|nr:isochorismate synthase [Zoogloeaceae bacterium]
MTKVSNLFAAGTPFALYRRPGQQAFLVWQATGEPLVRTEIPRGEDIEGFVFAPFAPCEDNPLLILGPGCLSTVWELPLDIPPPLAGKHFAGASFSGEDFQAYSRAFSRFSDALRHRALTKLVLSRARGFARRADFSPEHVFAHACRRYPAAFVSLFFSPRTGMWLGASPELLLGGEGGRWQTTAIAGTLPVETGKVAVWDAKNRREHRVVADFIGERLAALGIAPEMAAPLTCRAGNVAHIESNFYFSLPARKSPWDVIAALHPTPAVCGMPAEAAKRFILANEGYDREYYSGFLGPVEKETAVYVNLRCMKAEDGFLRLFSGSGIMPDSLLEQEWKETDHKMRTLFAVL